jgi:hypothetical protein
MLSHPVSLPRLLPSLTQNLIQKPLVYLLLLTGSLGLASGRDLPTPASLQMAQVDRIRIEQPVGQAIERPMRNSPDPDNGSTAKAIVGLTILGTGAAMLALTAKRAGYWGTSSNPSSVKPRAQANPRLQKQLLRLLHNDQKAANRLVTHAQRLHPERSADWVLEKVIYDLQRDRGR